MSLELEEKKLLRNRSFVINFPEHYQCRYTYAKSKYNILCLQKFPKYVSNYAPLIK